MLERNISGNSYGSANSPLHFQYKCSDLSPHSHCTCIPTRERSTHQNLYQGHDLPLLLCDTRYIICPSPHIIITSYPSLHVSRLSSLKLYLSHFAPPSTHTSITSYLSPTSFIISYLQGMPIIASLLSDDLCFHNILVEFLRYILMIHIYIHIYMSYID